MPTAHVSVESSGGSVYRVVVTEGRHKTTHDVTATPEDVARYAPGATIPFPGNNLFWCFSFPLRRCGRLHGTRWSRRPGDRSGARRGPEG